MMNGLSFVWLNLEYPCIIILSPWISSGCFLVQKMLKVLWEVHKVSHQISNKLKKKFADLCNHCSNDQNDITIRFLSVSKMGWGDKIPEGSGVVESFWTDKTCLVSFSRSKSELPRESSEAGLKYRYEYSEETFR